MLDYLSGFFAQAAPWISFPIFLCSEPVLLLTFGPAFCSHRNMSWYPTSSVWRWYMLGRNYDVEFTSHPFLFFSSPLCILAPSSGTAWSVSDYLCKNELHVLQYSAGFLCQSCSVYFTCCLTSGSIFDMELQHESRTSWPVPVQPVCVRAGEDRVSNTFWVSVF